jgi:enterochelin esterase family protein
MPASAQNRAAFNSHEVHADGTVTFRMMAPGAAHVTVILESEAKPLPLQKDSDGLWSVTTGPLAPEIYGYRFMVDGVPSLDPQNPEARNTLIFLWNNILVPGASPQPWEMQSIPHGTVHHHTYTTAIVQGLTAGQSEYYVYTPPAYDAKRAAAYPVLYLLHGWSDLSSGWTATGRVQNMLDALIAAGKAKPMVVVMPLGYGTMDTEHKLYSPGLNQKPGAKNASFSRVLLEEVMPRVEAEYHIERRREGRAIAGLSMGGLESLDIGLTHTEKFAWVGSFSGGADSLPKTDFPPVSAKQADLRLLWIACGTSDKPKLEPNRRLIAQLKAKGFPVTAIETPGMHTWIVWRDNFLHFAPLLFQDK